MIPNIEVLISLLVLFTGVLIFGIFSIFFFSRKKREVMESKFNKYKLILEIDVKNKEYKTLKVKEDKEYGIDVIDENDFLSISRLRDNLDTLELDGWFIKLLNILSSNKSYSAKEEFIESIFGKREKLRYMRKYLVFITLAQFDKQKHKLIFNVQMIKFHMEVNQELITPIVHIKEKALINSLINKMGNYKYPALIKLSPDMYYKRSSDPTFPPADTSAIIYKWLNRKYLTYITDEYDIYVALDVPKIYWGDKSIVKWAEKFIHKYFRQLNLFNKHIVSNIDAFEKRIIYLPEVTKDELRWAFSILKRNIYIDYSNTRSFFISENEFNDKYKRKKINAEIDQTYKSLEKKIQQMTLYYDDITLHGSTLLRTSLLDNERTLINNFTIMIKEKFVNKLYKLADEYSMMTHSNRIFINIHWKIANEIINRGKSLPFDMLVSYETPMKEISLWNSILLDKIKQSPLEFGLLVKTTDEFYIKVIENSKWKKVFISSYIQEQVNNSIKNQTILNKIDGAIKNNRHKKSRRKTMEQTLEITKER